MAALSGVSCKIASTATSVRTLQAPSLAVRSRVSQIKRLVGCAIRQPRHSTAAPAPARRLLSTTASTAAAAASQMAAQQQQAAFTIVGAGRVGEALAAMGGGKDVLLRRGQTVAQGGLPSGPIIIATRNDDLQEIVDATPPERRPGALRAAAAAVCLGLGPQHARLQDCAAPGLL